VWINAGDIILIGLRDYQDTKADVILKYNSDEARNLKAYGELPENGETADFTLTSRRLHNSSSKCKNDYTACIVGECLQCFDAVGWAAGRASGL